MTREDRKSGDTGRVQDPWKGGKPIIPNINSVFALRSGGRERRGFLLGRFVATSGRKLIRLKIGSCSPSGRKLNDFRLHVGSRSSFDLKMVQS